MASWGSSSSMVPVAVPSTMSAFTGVVRLRMKSSFGSQTVSGSTGTSIVNAVVPTGKVAVPFVAV